MQYIKTHKKIVYYLDKNIDNLNYISRNTGKNIHATLCGASKLHSLDELEMPQKLIDMIFENFDENLVIIHEFMQVQKYEVGDYILPHKDDYLFDLRLFNLTSSEIDGIVCEENDTFIFIKDIAGQEIKFNRTSWHWINPVREHRRYSLVIGT